MINKKLDQVIAIDFETANGKRSSPCAVGIAVFDFETGELKKKIHQLINPEMDFASFNERLTGLNAEMVKDAPTFPEILHLLTDELRDDDDIVVAHNAAFDMSVIDHSCERYRIQRPVFNHYCTYSLSRALLPGLAHYNLPIVCSACGINNGVHHRADDDAEACGRLFLTLCRKAGTADIEGLHSISGIQYGKMTKRYNSNCWADGECTIADTPNDPVEQAHKNPNSPFYQKTVVFTGLLSSMSREHAIQIVQIIGGRVGSSVTKKTSFLVTGFQDINALKGHDKSSKQRRADELLAQGCDIQILTEDDFLTMLV